MKKMNFMNNSNKTKPMKNYISLILILEVNSNIQGLRTFYKKQLVFQNYYQNFIL